MGQQIGSFFKSKYTGQQIENMLDSATNIADQYDAASSYVVGDLVLYNNGLYVCTGATSGTFDPSKWQQTTLDEILTNLGATYSDPNSDGNVVIGVDSTVGEKILRSISFPSLTNRYYLPFAQYIRERLQNDPSSASFSIEIPDAEEAPLHSTVIKGKTVAWNQRLHVSSTASTTVAGVTVTNNNDGSYTFNGTATGNGNFLLESSYPKSSDHSYLFIGYKQVGSNSGYLGYGGVSVDTGNGGIKTGGTGTWDIRIDIRTGDVFSNVKMYPMVIDLNNSPVANRLAEIGTDIAKLKQVWLEVVGAPLPQHIPYDAGSLANVNGEYRVRGRNLWDEEWELGSIDTTTGSNTSASNTIRSKNKTVCNPNTVYYFNVAIASVFWYDANDKYISFDYNIASGNVLTSPTNAKYFRFVCKSSYGTTYNYDITINESDPSINGQYFPYYNGGTIDCSTAPLNGVGTAQDEKDFATGKRVTRMQIDDMGDLTWYKNANWGMYATPSHAAKNFANWQIGNGVCSAYPTGEGKGAPDAGTFVVYGDYIRIGDTSYADGDAFKTAMTGQKVCYELATPVTTTETPQPVYTEYGYNVLEPVSGGVQSAEVDTVYYENIAGYIDKKLAEG